jgi:antitoxin (DNA-binding transcriptional repressor) of toxin-antitoxin stability system
MKRYVLTEMRIVELEVLENELAEYVRLAGSGETILISERGRVVAELVPPQPHPQALGFDATLAELVRAGLVTPALLPPGPPPESTPVAPLATILAEIEEDGAER